MKTKFFRIAIVVILCLTTLGKMLPQDSCEKLKLQNHSVVSYNNSSDISDSSDCKDCNCNCHHSHFDFAFLTKSLTTNIATIQIFSANLDSPVSPQIVSLIKPPKVVS